MGIANRFSPMTGKRRPVLHARDGAVAFHSGKMQQHCEPRGAFHQSADRRSPQADDQVTFPVSGYGPISCFRRSFTDHDLRRDATTGSGMPCIAASLRVTQSATRSSAGPSYGLTGQPATPRTASQKMDQFYAALWTYFAPPLTTGQLPHSFCGTPSVTGASRRTGSEPRRHGGSMGRIDLAGVARCSGTWAVGCLNVAIPSRSGGRKAPRRLTGSLWGNARHPTCASWTCWRAAQGNFVGLVWEAAAARNLKVN